MKPPASASATTEATVVDLLFPLSGSSVPEHYQQDLLEALQQDLKWLVSEHLVGIRLLRLASVSGRTEARPLSSRSCLSLRLPRVSVAQAALLGGREITLQRHTVRLGEPRCRELIPYATLYAHAVAASQDDEINFLSDIERELQSLAVRTQVVCGTRSKLQLREQTLTTFSLMLHPLDPAESLRVQALGLGPYRSLGCGLFVPHKSASAVGE